MVQCTARIVGRSQILISAPQLIGVVVMVNYADLKYLRDSRRRLKDLADDENYCEIILEHFDSDPELRDELPDIYVRALKTKEAKSRR